MFLSWKDERINPKQKYKTTMAFNLWCILCCRLKSPAFHLGFGNHVTQFHLTAQAKMMIKIMIKWSWLSRRDERWILLRSKCGRYCLCLVYELLIFFRQSQGRFLIENAKFATYWFLWMDPTFLKSKISNRVEILSKIKYKFNIIFCYRKSTKISYSSSMKKFNEIVTLTNRKINLSSIIESTM